jgi:predicted KAP-like P-loop ATPase
METASINQKSRLNLVVTAELNEQMLSWSERLAITLSELTRNALREYIERLEQDRLERELAEACSNYREFNKQFSSDWSRYETRVK